ncbi:hypothetical protein [Morganella morganii]|uniref:hypothetical protein n=1 Tax=Morganella morganii TaxID=582 RepID=UPI001BDAC8DA|nr:hypothetical protein [Morganella morganii]MBT0520910.1 hypothetical protein [Morganella morganii subsp. morganii]QWL90482.1 hypothetical protein IZ187_04605 [Morganella morganii subsp. morganii]
MKTALKIMLGIVFIDAVMLAFKWLLSIDIHPSVYMFTVNTSLLLGLYVAEFLRVKVK